MTTHETSSKSQQDRLNPVVFFTSAGLITAFSLMTIFSPTSPGSGSPAR